MRTIREDTPTDKDQSKPHSILILKIYRRATNNALWIPRLVLLSSQQYHQQQPHQISSPEGTAFLMGAKTDEFPSKNNLCNFVFFWTIFFVFCYQYLSIFNQIPRFIDLLAAWYGRPTSKGNLILLVARVSSWSTDRDNLGGSSNAPFLPRPHSCPWQGLWNRVRFLWGFPGVGTVLFALTEDTDTRRWAHFDVPVAHVLWLTLDGLSCVGSGLDTQEQRWLL